MQLMRLVRNIAFDLRYGAFLGGEITTRHADAGARNVANTDYAVLQSLFNQIIEANDVLVDVGCGKGRVLNWWLRFYARNRIIGIELDREVAEKTRRRLHRHPQVAVYAGNILDVFPEEGTFFYLFNPFDRLVMQQFINAFFAHRPQGSSRSRKILYYNCVYHDLFTEDSRFETRFLATHATAHPALVATEVTRC